MAVGGSKIGGFYLNLEKQYYQGGETTCPNVSNVTINGKSRKQRTAVTLPESGEPAYIARGRDG